MFTYIFRVEYYYDDEPHYECGMLYAPNFAQAAAKLEEYYGNDMTNILCLEPYDVGMFTFCDEDRKKVESLLEKCVF